MAKKVEEVPAFLEVKNYQPMEDVSCIHINDPEVDMVVNTSDTQKKVLVKDSASGSSVILAPGEDKKPSNMNTNNEKTKQPTIKIDT